MKNQSYDNARDIFISNISHDVRTLLNSIFGHTQILSKDKNLNDTHKELIDKILDASSHMIDLINEIINISKNVGVGNLNICEFNLNTLILNIYSIFESIASSKNVQIILNNNIEADFIIKSDKNKLFYILLNIIGNAIKFTNKGSVTFNCKMNDENSILFEIIDTGIGIDKTMQNEIFNSYTRTEEGSHYEGNGLGLAIANKNILALGSKLNISSTKGEGSTFSFIIRCETSKGDFLSFDKEVFELKEIKSLKDSYELFVLIVEDTSKQKSILETYLGLKNINYKIINNENDIIDSLRLYNIDIIFLDISLTKKDPNLIVNKIQKTSKGIPIIALTASVMSDDLKLISKSFTNYIIKPYSFSDIDQTLILFSGKEFEFVGDNESDKEGLFIVIKDEELKEDIINFAKLGQYKKLSELIENVNDKKSKALLKKHLSNYNFNEIVHSIKEEIL